MNRQVSAGLRLARALHRMQLRIQCCGTVGGLMVLAQIWLDRAGANVAIELASRSEQPADMSVSSTKSESADWCTLTDIYRPHLTPKIPLTERIITCTPYYLLFVRFFAFFWMCAQMICEKTTYSCEKLGHPIFTFGGSISTTLGDYIDINKWREMFL